MELNELKEAYLRQIELAYREKKLSTTYYEHLTRKSIADLDQLMEVVHEFIHAMTHAEYYITLDRITKGEEKIAMETDEKKKSEYRKLLNDLTVKLEQLSPKGESA